MTYLQPVPWDHDEAPPGSVRPEDGPDVEASVARSVEHERREDPILEPAGDGDGDNGDGIGMRHGGVIRLVVDESEHVKGLRRSTAAGLRSCMDADGGGAHQSKQPNNKMMMAEAVVVVVVVVRLMAAGRRCAWQCYAQAPDKRVDDGTMQTTGHAGCDRG